VEVITRNEGVRGSNPRVGFFPSAYTFRERGARRRTSLHRGGAVPHQFTPGTPVERLFAEIVRAVEVGLYVFQVDDPADAGSLRLVYVNPASTAATGVPFAEIIGRPLREAFPALIGTGVPAAYLAIALGAEAQDLGEIEYADERVEQQVFSVRAFPLPQRRVGVSFTNFTSQRDAEQQAVQTLEAMSDAFFTLDTDWRFTYLNPQSELILERRREDLVGRNMWEEFPAAVDTPFYEAYHRAMNERVPVRIEEAFEPLGRTIELRAYPVEGGLAVYFTDVTRARMLEARLRQTQRLEALGRVTAGVAHDFNNLLTAVGGYAQLGRAAATDETIASYFAEIESASGRAETLTRQLLAFGRQQELSPAVVDLNEVVDGLGSLLRHVLPAGIELRLALSPRPVDVVVDPSQLEQVLLNLVVNGRDAIGAAGAITVATSGEDPAGIVRDTATRSGWLQVIDTGSGIPTEIRPHIFDPFFTTKAQETGTGLGLATIYGIVTQSGGEIFVDSTVGVGTTMSVALPAEPIEA